MRTPSIFIAIENSYLAGIFGRKFERDGWEVTVIEKKRDIAQRAMESPPHIMLFDDSPRFQDIVDLVEQFRSLPTMQSVEYVLATHTLQHKHVQMAHDIGIHHHVHIGHFLPSEVVRNMRRILS
ncbi:MAG: hypothetical protein O3B64_03815 [bacterium]|nr:hypothetical protein [bacterium]